MLSVNTSGVGVFDIIHMRVSSTDAQFLVFGYDHNWQPFCLAIRDAQRSMGSCKPDARIYVPQLKMDELTVGSIGDMMTLVNEMKLQRSQKRDLRDRSVGLHVLPPNKVEVSCYLSSAHHVRLKWGLRTLKNRGWIDVRIDKEFLTERTPKPHRWSWRQL